MERIRTEKVKCFEDLEVWKKSHSLVLDIYNITDDYPEDEKFGLISQMRRAAISIPANIAEGFKKRGINDKIKFYNISQGSLSELRYYLILSGDLNYLSDTGVIIEKAETIGRMLNGLITSLNKNK